MEGLVQVAGNAVLDLPVRGVEWGNGEAADSWGKNVQLLEAPIEAALGGCGAAPAYLLGRLGVKVALNTNLGEDAWGKVVAGWLRGAGVEIASPAAEATAVNVIALDGRGRRRSLYFAGEKVEWGRSLEGERPVWFMASGYGRVDGGDLAEMRRVFAEFRRRGVGVMFDPGPWFAGRVSGEEMLAAWGEVDCLVATQEELAVWQEAGDPIELARRIVGLGPRRVVVKRGSAGATYATAAGEFGAVGVETAIAGNSVGAGDSFNGRLLYGIAGEESAREAVTAAVELATGVVRRGKGVLGVDEIL